MRVSFSLSGTHISVLQTFIKDQAAHFLVEGSLQIFSPQNIRVVVCGQKDSIDLFVDALFKTVHKNCDNVHLEPFLKNRDYRGKFRIIE